MACVEESVIISTALVMISHLLMLAASTLGAILHNFAALLSPAPLSATQSNGGITLLATSQMAQPTLRVLACGMVTPKFMALWLTFKPAIFLKPLCPPEI